MMVRELMLPGHHITPGFGVLIVASFFRDSIPWLYEMGVEVYRVARHGSSTELQAAADEFRQAVEFALRGPLSRELFARSKDMFMIMEEVEPLLERSLSMLFAGSSNAS